MAEEAAYNMYAPPGAAPPSFVLAENSFFPAPLAPHTLSLDQAQTVNISKTRNREIKSMIPKKRKREIQSMILDDIYTQGAFKTRRTTTAYEPSEYEEHGIEIKAVESEKDREMLRKCKVLMRQQKAFDTYITRRRQALARNRNRHTQKRGVRSCNMVHFTMPETQQNWETIRGE